MFIPEAERNEHALAEVCVSLHEAIRWQNAEPAWCYLSAACSLACARASDQRRGEVNLAAIALEADLQNERWGSAARSAATFERAARAAAAVTPGSN